MLTLPTEPLFFETMMRFVRTFVPTLTIHRVHVAERKEEPIIITNRDDRWFFDVC